MATRRTRSSTKRSSTKRSAKRAASKAGKHKARRPDLPPTSRGSGVPEAGPDGSPVPTPWIEPGPLGVPIPPFPSAEPGAGGASAEGPRKRSR
jgi:hypothetical protein